MRVACVAASRLTLRSVSRYPIVHCDRDRIHRKKTDFRNVPARAYTSFITKCNFTPRSLHSLSTSRPTRSASRQEKKWNHLSRITAANCSARIRCGSLFLPPSPLCLSVCLSQQNITNPMYLLQLSDGTSICRCYYRRWSCLIKGKHKYKHR